MDDTEVVRILCEVDYMTLRLITRRGNNFYVSIESDYIALFDVDTHRKYRIRKMPELVEAFAKYRKVNIEVKVIVSEETFEVIPDYLLLIDQI